jgi:hypothetical protein
MFNCKPLALYRNQAPVRLNWVFASAVDGLLPRAGSIARSCSPGCHVQRRDGRLSTFNTCQAFSYHVLHSILQDPLVASFIHLFDCQDGGWHGTRGCQTKLHTFRYRLPKAVPEPTSVAIGGSASAIENICRDVSRTDGARHFKPA